MRASPLTEHKLSLHQFVTTPPGDLLLGAAASAAGAGLGELKAIIAGLPDLDFYIPASQHRLAWRATADYVVAVSLNGRAPMFGYGADGRAVALDLSRPDPPTHAVLMLQTAELKTRRIHPQASRSGLTIQDPGDGELGGLLVFVDRSGRMASIELADIVHPDAASDPNALPCDGCSGGGGGGGGTPPPPPPSTFLTYISSSGIVDNNNPFESNEFEFLAKATDGTVGGLRITGIPSSTNQARHDFLIKTSPTLGPNNPFDNSRRIDISVKETDGWPNGDDDFNFIYPPLQPPPFMDPNYCGPVPLGREQDDNGRTWAMIEDSCSAGADKKLAVTFGW